MKTIVTGGAGFIGSHLTSLLLERGHQVVVVDDFSTGRAENLEGMPVTGKLTIAEADIVGPQAAHLVGQVRPDVMFLLAAQSTVQVSMHDPMLDARANVLGLVNMLEAARLAGCHKIVFASSGGTIYGQVEAERLPVTEDHAHAPLSFYGVTKSVAAEYLRLYHTEYGVDYAVLALGNVYGPRQQPNSEGGVVATFVNRLLQGLPCRINGDGTTTRDYVHVSDVAEAFAAAARSGTGVFNIGTGIETSLLELHHLLSERTGARLEPEFGPPLRGEVRQIRLDISRSRTQLSWRPSIRIDEGVDSVVEWLRSTPQDLRASDDRTLSTQGIRR
ncbi:NAD-dependent epimerase/dehydratase family protein [Micromonospora sp. CPCC 205539]|uniref:NAD-dependent epimerase/dehydratase family protein n=1 Tax=Micromonospora sp. CPCC 205539 TaxID=3122408 RepID=UPI002FF15623